MRTLLLFTLAMAMSYAADTTYSSSTYAFSVEPPVVAEHQGIQVATFFLPARDGFAANVNIQIQAYADTLASYDTLNRHQFEALGLKLINSEKDKQAITYEYSGEMGGRPLHWYAKAIKRGDEIILITATALQHNWEEDKEILMSSVNSLQLKE